MKTKLLFLILLLCAALSFAQTKDSYPAKESFENETSIINFKKDNSSKLGPLSIQRLVRVLLEINATN